MHCNHEYKNQKPRHTCYCGKQNDPVFDRYREPNSCGKICNKNLTKNCNHKCAKICHIGPCEEDDKENYFACFCAKNTLKMKCVEYNDFEKRSCA